MKVLLYRIRRLTSPLTTESLSLYSGYNAKLPFYLLSTDVTTSTLSYSMNFLARCPSRNKKSTRETRPAIIKQKDW